MRKRKIILLVFIATTAMLLAFSACQAEQAPLLPPTTAPTSTAFVTPSKTITQTPTLTTTPTQTLNPRDFDVTSITTVTPASPAQCPEINDSIDFDVQMIVETIEFDEEYTLVIDLNTEKLLDYLNQGVSPEIINNALSEIKKNSVKFYIVDVTGDGIKEFVYTHDIGINIIGCENEQYALMNYFFSNSASYEPTFLAIDDFTQNGINDIAVQFPGCMGGRCPYFQIFSWNGDELIDITADECHYGPNYASSLSLEDIDDNQTYEVIYKYKWGYRPNGLYEIYPLRTQTVVCMWNGSQYLLAENTFGEPIYRLQAVQDGDTQTTLGNFDAALDFYQMAINDPDLDWFTPEKNAIAYWDYMSEIWNNPDVKWTVPADMAADPNEYPNLAAYSYFRIILLHLLQNQFEDAQTTLATLQSEFPPNETGYVFTRMAGLLIEEYQKSNNIENACVQAIEYAQANHASLLVLDGNAERTMYPIRLYTPMCPYLPEGHGEE